MNTKIRIAGSAAVVVLAIKASATRMSAQVRLSARKNKVINGIEAQLSGDYRKRTSPIRLNFELENINFPGGTKVAYSGWPAH